VLKGNLSPQLTRHLARGFPEHNPSKLTLVRQAFDGMPLRIVTGLIGEVVLSMIRSGATPDWHRGRNDTIASGAPSQFIPGFDLAATIDTSSCILEVIPGSGRLSVSDPNPKQISTPVELDPCDLAILDSRLLRRWSAESGKQVFWFSVIRPWLTPLDDFEPEIRSNTPPRALRFFGLPWQPAREVGQWIFTSHTKRSTDAGSGS
jgi:hypothetical protein